MARDGAGVGGVDVWVLPVRTVPNAGGRNNRVAITRELPRPTGEGRFGSFDWSAHRSDLASPPRTRYGTAPRDDPRTITVRPGVRQDYTSKLTSPSPTQSFEHSDDETQHPRDADGDNVSAATTYAHTQEARV
jgi:hypothetical protein